MMNTRKTLTVLLMVPLGFQIAAMQQPNLRQQLINAAKEGNVDQVEQLMSAGAPVDPEALWHPTIWGKYDVVKTIFESGVDPESPVDPNQMFAGKPIFEHLLRSYGTSAPQDRKRLIRLYIKHGVDLDSIPSPIRLVHPLEASILELLLQHGADVNAQDLMGKTVLLRIAGHLIPKKVPEDKEYLSVYKQLINRSAEALIKHGADVNLETGGKVTSLMLAARQGNKPLVELLLENGANVDLKDAEGKSALDYAREEPEILKLLKDAQKTSSEKS